MAVQVQTSLGTFVPASILAAMTEDVRASLSLEIAHNLRSRWIALAQQSLTTTLKDYLPAIQQERLEGQAAVVSLVGAVPNTIEHGSPAYDMRKTLLGPNVPIVVRGSGKRGMQRGKDGTLYRSIPFRHQTPGSGNGPQAMRHAKPMGHAYQGSLGEQAARDLGKAIHAAAKKLTPSTSEPHFLKGQGVVTTNTKGKVQSHKTQAMQRPHMQARLPAGTAGATKLRPHHSTDIYAGMVRLQKTYRKATQASYMTFRTISTRNMTGWQHPATPGANLMKQLEQELPEIAQGVINNFVAGAHGALSP